jgi:hypothetical protein
MQYSEHNKWLNPTPIPLALHGRGLANRYNPCRSVELKKYISFVAAIFLAASCSISNHKDASEFKGRWEESGNHSAVSWWYVGESENTYYLKEKWPLDHYSYAIPKTMITLVGIQKMEPCKFCEGINLKVWNVKFN